MKLPPFLVQRWQTLSGREQRVVRGGLALLVAALLWWLGLAPALSTLRLADSQRQRLDAELQRMQGLQAQARTLQALPPIALADARRLLEASLRPLGTSAQLQLAGERATVTLKGVPANALAPWLMQVRLNVRTVPAEARLLRNAAGNWDGTLVLNLK